MLSCNANFTCLTVDDIHFAIVVAYCNDLFQLKETVQNDYGLHFNSQVSFWGALEFWQVVQRVYSENRHEFNIKSPCEMFSLQDNFMSACKHHPRSTG